MNLFTFKYLEYLINLKSQKWYFTQKSFVCWLIIVKEHFYFWLFRKIVLEMEL